MLTLREENIHHQDYEPYLPREGAPYQISAFMNVTDRDSELVKAYLDRSPISIDCEAYYGLFNIQKIQLAKNTLTLIHVISLSCQLIAPIKR